MAKRRNRETARRTFTQVERAVVRRKCNGRCAYCGSVLPEKGWHVDHIQAHRRRGTNEMSNLNPACRTCNLFKHTYGLEGFREQLEAQIERARKYSVNFRMAELYGMLVIVPERAKVVFYFEQGSPPTTVSEPSK